MLPNGKKKTHTNTKLPFAQLRGWNAHHFPSIFLGVPPKKSYPNDILLCQSGSFPGAKELTWHSAGKFWRAGNRLGCSVPCPAESSTTCLPKVGPEAEGREALQVEPEKPPPGRSNSPDNTTHLRPRGHQSFVTAGIPSRASCLKIQIPCGPPVRFQWMDKIRGEPRLKPFLVFIGNHRTRAS